MSKVEIIDDFFDGYDNFNIFDGWSEEEIRIFKIRMKKIGLTEKQIKNEIWIKQRPFTNYYPTALDILKEHEQWHVQYLKEQLEWYKKIDKDYG